MGSALLKATAIGSSTTLISFALSSLAWQQLQDALSLAAQAPSLSVPVFLNTVLLTVGAGAAAWWSVATALVIASLLHGASTVSGERLRATTLLFAPRALKGLLTTTAGLGLVLSSLPAQAVEFAPEAASNRTSIGGAAIHLGVAHNEAHESTPEISLAFGDSKLAQTERVVRPDDSERTATGASSDFDLARDRSDNASLTRPIDTSTQEGTGKGSVVVRVGDCLWDIAARNLPEGSSNAEVTILWQEIYRLNRAEIGNDPNLLHQGITLRLPS